MAYFLLYHLAAGGPIGGYLAGFALLGGTTLLLAVLTRGQIGGGDIKLFALVGLALGWEAGLAVLAGSTLIAAAFALPLLVLRLVKPGWRRIRELPMAPFIAVSAVTLMGAAVFM